MIKTKGLKFKDILSYPDLEFKDNKMNFIVGRSGSGKSTLIKIINSTNTVDDGMVFIDGKDINELEAVALRKDFLLCGQNVFLFNGTIHDNFKQFYELRDETLISKEKIQYFLDLACVEFNQDDSVNQMSSGERQRIYLAIFISLARKVIILDEPTSALDKETSEAFMTNLKNHIRTNALTLIMISHNDELANEYADEIINLNEIMKEVSNG